jgi:phosphate transport system substrate-binding protein
LKETIMKKTGACITATLFIILSVITTGCEKRDSSTAAIQVKGSDTEVNLVQRMAESFMEKKPEAAIAVTGGGSGTGIAALINGQTDIANSSRAMKQEEIKRAKDKGVDPAAVVFALDGLAVITHQSFPFDSLNLDVLAGVFKGDISHWKEINGPDVPVSLYGRQSNSGTFIFFRDYVLKGEYSQNMKRMNGTAQIVEAIKQDRGGIGYVGIGYVVDRQGKVIPGIRVLNIAKDAGSQAISPLDPENVKSGLYPISRPLYQYTNGVPSGRILEFIQFELSDEGQKIVTREGYYPVTAEYMKANNMLGILQ